MKIATIKRIAALALTLLVTLSCFALCISAEEVTEAPIADTTVTGTVEAPTESTVSTVLKGIFSGTNLALLG